MEEERKITSKFVQSTAVLQQDKALIPFKGNEGFDITDSIAIDVKIEVDSRDVPVKIFNIKELYRDGRRLAPDQVSITPQEWRLPATDQVPIPLCARLDYLVRTVHFGDKTVIEGDDSVEFQRGSLPPISVSQRMHVHQNVYVNSKRADNLINQINNDPVIWGGRR